MSAIQSASRSHFRFAPKINAILRANAGFSALSGVALVLASAPIARFLGFEANSILIAVGAGLLIFAADLFWLASRDPVNRKLAWAVVASDVAWVAASAWLLLAAPAALTTGGKWTVAIVADIVAVFALLQSYALLTRR